MSDKKKRPTLTELEAKAARVGELLAGEIRASEGYGFALLCFNFEGGHMTYASNAKREDMILALEEMVVRLKTKTVAPRGQPNHSANKLGKS